MDNDLTSIQEARDLISSAYAAWQSWSHATQADVDRVCEAMAEAGVQAAERLGQLAYDETGYGHPLHKKLKNITGSRLVWESIRAEKTVGVIKHDPEKKVTEIAWPIGVIAALVPSTNPTSTTLYKALIAVKARDAIVFAPHPSAARCTFEAAKVMAEAAEKAGAPKGLIACMQHISLEGTQALMTHKRTALILATGGTPMVRAAHSTGKPAYGVGPGNVPVYVDRTADIAKAARYIVASKAFDCSTICATEQAVVADRPIAAQLAALMHAEGAFFCDAHQTNLLRKTVFLPNGAMNTAVVGKPAPYVAAYAGFDVPFETRILVTPLTKVGREEPLSHEKLTTVLAWYEVDGWEKGCETSISLIETGGKGHTQIIYAQDERVILAFGLEKPVFRILVNTMGTLGAVGLTTGLDASFTLGSGGVGGAITGDNITARHLINVKRLAYELYQPPLEALQPVERKIPPQASVVESAIENMLQEILRR
jgi:acetaldehyde dehydrogenase (acetylating)